MFTSGWFCILSLVSELLTCCRLVLYRIQLDLFLLVEPCQVQRRVRRSNKPDFGFGSFPEELKKPLRREVKRPVSCDTALIITVTWTIQNLHQHVNYNKNPPNTHCLCMWVEGWSALSRLLLNDYVSIFKTRKRRRRQSRPLSKYLIRC